MKDNNERDQEEVRARIALRAERRKGDDKISRLTVALIAAHGYTAVACAVGGFAASRNGHDMAVCAWLLAGILSWKAAHRLWTSSKLSEPLSLWAALLSIMVFGGAGAPVFSILVNVAGLGLIWALSEKSAEPGPPQP